MRIARFFVRRDSICAFVTLLVVSILAAGCDDGVTAERAPVRAPRAQSSATVTGADEVFATIDGVEITLGSVTSAVTAGNSSPSVFAFSAETAGVLTVVVRGQGDADLLLDVTDSLGQRLPKGRSDQDLNDDGGAEQVVVTIPRAGDYRVEVLAWGAGGPFDIAAGWISFPALGRDPDPDGLPTDATELVPGTPIDDQIDPSSGDLWDWYKITAVDAVVVTVLTEAPEGDLVIELYNDGEFGDYENRSDQDLGGVNGNESMTVQAQAGQTYYFKIAPAFESGQTIPYRIRVGIM